MPFFEVQHLVHESVSSAEKVFFDSGDDVTDPWLQVLPSVSEPDEQSDQP